MQDGAQEDSVAGRSTLTSSVAVAGMPWSFTQRHPLDSNDFIREAKQRGVDLDDSTLRELYRHGVLSPFLVIRHRKVTEPVEPVVGEPSAYGSLLLALRDALGAGTLQDPALVPFMPRLPFERRGQRSRWWWNGLLYSRYQLTMLPQLYPLLQHRKRRLRSGRLVTKLPVPDRHYVESLLVFRRAALAATALEARYLPALDSEWLRLTNVEPGEWRAYRTSFDPVAVSGALNYPADQARQDAEQLLIEAHRIDPLGGSWGKLVRRTPPDKWKDLRGDALIAMDLREAAEILLRFYEDLADHGAAEPLPELPSVAWHPLRERISNREQTLDEQLTSLGLSPHPRVVLAIEGWSEEKHIPKIWEALGYPDAPELVRILKLGGVDRDLEKVAALAVSPLVSKQDPDKRYWQLIKPPTRLMVAVDPEGKYFAPNKVAKTRAQIIREIRDVLRAQGIQPNEADLDELVDIRTWNGGSCYELAHFTDEELADALIAVHQTANGLTREQLIESIGQTRQRRKDIKEVWSRWDHEPSKVALALALWPALECKIEVAKTNPTTSVPEIVGIVLDAYHTAQRWRYSSFVLTAETPEAQENKE